MRELEVFPGEGTRLELNCDGSGCIFLLPSVRLALCFGAPDSAYVFLFIHAGQVSDLSSKAQGRVRGGKGGVTQCHCTPACQVLSCDRQSQKHGGQEWPWRWGYKRELCLYVLMIWSHIPFEVDGAKVTDTYAVNIPDKSDPAATAIPNTTSSEGTSITPTSAPTPNLAMVSRHIGDSKPPQAIVKPQILTHIIEGFVIQEGAEPFPVGILCCGGGRCSALLGG